MYTTGALSLCTAHSDTECALGRLKKGFQHCYCCVCGELFVFVLKRCPTSIYEALKGLCWMRSFVSPSQLHTDRQQYNLHVIRL